MKVGEPNGAYQNLLKHIRIHCNSVETVELSRTDWSITKVSEA